MERVTNIYQLMNNELERLHHAAGLIDREHHRSIRGSIDAMGNPTYGYGGYMDPRTVWQMITRMHEVMLKAMETHDAKVQEKVAELALMDAQK